MSKIKQTLYEQLKNAGCEIDAWQTDLYVKSTSNARAIIKEYESNGGISNKTEFKTQETKELWIELPFHYDPAWINKNENPSVENDEPVSEPTFR